jgi:hypothetical protein
VFIISPDHIPRTYPYKFGNATKPKATFSPGKNCMVATLLLYPIQCGSNMHIFSKIKHGVSAFHKGRMFTPKVIKIDRLV